jgi:pimeloyl-ACP methyl ester carboxylesterase
MPRKVYALFVGIDEYASPVRPLHGCVNDIQRMKTLLEKRIRSEQDEFIPRTLTNSQATRANIIAAFETHLAQAGSEDVVLFYYSGHGSQEMAPPEFWHLEPDHQNETLVCYDSRQPGSWDLADKELSQLIAKVAKNGAHVCAILDSCHSGSGTRDALDDLEAGVAVRLQAADRRIRPLDSYILSPEQAATLYKGQNGQKRANWIALPQGRHILIAACSDDETAKEMYLDGERRGVFSYYLQDTLQSTTGSLSYRNLFKRIQALVSTRVRGQTPVLEATDAQDVEQPFLGGAIPERSHIFSLRHQDHRWLIDGGAVHGISAPRGEETTVLSIFPLDANLDKLGSLKDAVGEARVEAVEAIQSEVTITTRDGISLDRNEVYQAIVVGEPLPPLVVALEGDEAALNLVRDALAQASPNLQSSQLVREGSSIEAEYRLRAVRHQVGASEKAIYRISRKADAYPLAVDTEGFSKASAELVARRLEHIARWQKIAELSNKTSGIPTDAIRVEFFRVGQNDELEAIDSLAEMHFEYRPPFEEMDYPRFRVKLTNTGEQTYYCMLLNLTQDYSVFTGLLPDGIVRLKPGKDTWGSIRGRRDRLYEDIPVTIPDPLYKLGITQLRDIVKLIVCTDLADATLLAMDSLPVSLDKTVDETEKRSIPIPASTLERLMERVNTRVMNNIPGEDEAYSDWCTLEFSSVVVRPMQSQPIAQPGREVQLAEGVALQGHARLDARVRLDSLQSTAREVGSLISPAVFRSHADTFQPFEFTASRGGEPGLTVLKLEDVADHSVVTPQNPLVLTLAGAVAENESILPYAYDGEFFLPLGRARVVNGQTEIRLERLPVPTSAGERDLKGSIKIMFQKIVAEKTGLDYAYPRLAVATFADEEVRYLVAPTEVRQNVEEAENILLYLHGFTSDTQGMVRSAVEAGLDKSHLILAFDYESINTPIEDTARLLGEQLEQVGLGPGHGKTVYLVAHSLGGLVARWFVERAGGNKIVQHLVTLGTPHQGTPWPKIYDWATNLLILGLNSLSSVAWPVKLIVSLIKVIETVDNTVDQLGPDTAFIKSLASNPDPGIPITALAGNTSIIPAAFDVQPGEAKSRLEQLVSTLGEMRLLEKAAGLAFFGQPNDIAVSVNSATGLPAGHKLATTAEIACDHMSFFDTPDSLVKLSEVLRS